MTDKIVHADQDNEFSMCGYAIDAYESGDVGEPVIFAKPGEKFNCEACKRVIAFAKTFKRDTQPKEARNRSVIAAAMKEHQQ